MFNLLHIYILHIYIYSTFFIGLHLYLRVYYVLCVSCFSCFLVSLVFLFFVFENIHTLGQAIDSLPEKLEKAKKRSFVLRHELTDIILRRDGTFLKNLLKKTGCTF